MNIHPVADEIITSGNVPTRDGMVVRVHSHVTRETCELLYDVVKRSGATRGVEIGMAFGVSSVCLSDALRRNASDARLVSFDPTQRRADSWNGAGLFQLERAGLADVVELREETSQSGLPRLAASGYRCRIAFIDGWHTFDHTLVDFFYVDQMLDAEGYVVFDDVDYPAIESVLRFILANRNYSLEAVVSHSRDGASPLLRAKRMMKTAARRVARTHRDPLPQHDSLFRRIAGAKTVALRKLREDDRPFDHFRAF